MGHGFGRELARLRRQANLSQAELALRSSVSQRQVSFLETGRSLPGRETVENLAHGLALPAAQTQWLFIAAGFTRQTDETSLSAEDFQSIRAVLHRILEKHAPYPGIVTRRDGTAVMTNTAFDRLLDFASPQACLWTKTCEDRPRNLYDLTLHPDGLIRFLQNADEIVPHLIRRVQSMADWHDGARALYRRLQTYPATVRFGAFEDRRFPTASIVPERYSVAGRPISLISTVSCFGSPEDATAQDIQIELFFHSDQETGQFLETLAADHAR